MENYYTKDIVSNPKLTATLLSTLIILDILILVGVSFSFIIPIGVAVGIILIIAGYLKPGFALSLAGYGKIVVTIFLAFFGFYSGVTATTYSIAVLSILIFIFSGKVEALYPRGILPFIVLLFGFFLLFQLKHTPSVAYGKLKVLRYFAFNVFIFMLPLCLIGRTDRQINILKYIFAMGLFLGFLSFAVLIISGGSPFERFTLSTEVNPITFGRIMGLALICLFFLAWKTDSKLKRLLLMLCIPPIFLPLLLTGTRAVVVSLMLSACFFILFYPKWSVKRKIFLVFIILGSALFVFIAFKGILPQRFYKTSPEEVSVLDRLWFWKVSFEHFLEHKLTGVGVGGFEFLMHRYAKYPHNVFFEVAVENGLVGLVLLFTFLVLTVWNFFSIYRSNLYSDLEKKFNLALMTYFVFAMVNACFSFDITGNDGVWFASGLLFTLKNSK